ncbi:MAG: ABC transporter permease [Candidatus Aminicenantia bacterium]
MFKIAWRNIWRNKRRTILTILAIFFSVFLISSMVSIQEGTYKNTLEKITKIWNGKLIIFAKGYFGRESLNKSFLVNKNLIEKLNSLNINWTERIDGYALASYGYKTYGVSITGINSGREVKVTELKEKIIEGAFLGKGKRGYALLGEKLAKNLKIKIGEEVAVIAQGRDGSIGAKLFKVAGIFRTHVIEIDRAKIIVNLEDADEVFSMGGRVTTTVIYFSEHENNLEGIKSFLQRELNEEGLEIVDWRDIMPEILELIEFDRASGYIAYLILLKIVGFGLMNTIYMIVFERRKEIGVLRAVGMSGKKIILLIIIESIYMGLIGAISGFLFSYPVIYYFSNHPNTDIRRDGRAL